MMHQTISDFRKGVKLPSSIKGVQNRGGAGGGMTTLSENPDANEARKHESGDGIATSQMPTMAEHSELQNDPDAPNKGKAQSLMIN